MNTNHPKPCTCGVEQASKNHAFGVDTFILFTHLAQTRFLPAQGAPSQLRPLLELAWLALPVLSGSLLAGPRTSVSGLLRLSGHSRVSQRFAALVGECLAARHGVAFA